MRQITHIIFAVGGLILGFWGLAKGLDAMGILHVFARSELVFMTTMTSVGIIGGIISWLMSTSIGQWSLNARPYDTEDAATAPSGDLTIMVAHLSTRLGMRSAPSISVYDSADINAFAAGPIPRFSKLCISSGLMNCADKNKVEAILAQVLAKLAAGDVSVLLLMHGMINVFTVFPTRMFALLLGTTLRTAEEETPSDGVENWMKVAFELIFTPFAGLITRRFARSAETRADEKADQIVGNHTLTSTLQTLASSQQSAKTREMFTAPLMFGALVHNSLQPLSYHLSMRNRAELLSKRKAA